MRLIGIRPAFPAFRASRAFRTVPLLALGTLLALSTTAQAQKIPEPSLYQIAPELEFRSTVPRRIVVETAGDPVPKAYWYMTYSITNNGDKPYRFLPAFDLVTFEGKIVRSDRGISQQVFDKIQKQTGIKLLEPAKKIEGMIQPGEDQARDGVAIWPEPENPRMQTFEIFVGGLSDEFVELKDKDGKKMTAKNAAGEEEPIIFRKTLQITVHVAGDEVRPGNDPVKVTAKKWIMR